MYNRPGSQQDVDDCCIFGCGLVAEGCDADAAVYAFDPEGIFYGYGEAVEGAEGGAGASEVSV